MNSNGSSLVRDMMTNRKRSRNAIYNADDLAWVFNSEPMSDLSLWFVLT